MYMYPVYLSSYHLTLKVKQKIDLICQLGYVEHKQKQSGEDRGSEWVSEWVSEWQSE